MRTPEREMGEVGEERLLQMAEQLLILKTSTMADQERARLGFGGEREKQEEVEMRAREGETEILHDRLLELTSSLESAEAVITKLEEEKVALCEALDKRKREEEKPGFLTKNLEKGLGLDDESFDIPFNAEVSGQLAVSRMRRLSTQEHAMLLGFALEAAEASAAAASGREGQLATELQETSRREALLKAELETMEAQLKQQASVCFEQEKELKSLREGMDVTKAAVQEERYLAFRAAEQAEIERCRRLGAEEWFKLSSFGKQGMEGEKEFVEEVEEDWRQEWEVQMKRLQSALKEAECRVRDLEKVLEEDSRKVQERNDSEKHDNELLKMKDVIRAQEERERRLMDQLLLLQMRVLCADERFSLLEIESAYESEKRVSHPEPSVGDVEVNKIGRDEETFRLKKELEIAGAAMVERGNEREENLKLREKVAELEKSLLRASCIGKEAITEARALTGLVKEVARDRSIKEESANAVEKVETVEQTELFLCLQEELHISKLKLMGIEERERIAEASSVMQRTQSEAWGELEVGKLQTRVNELEAEVLQKRKELDAASAIKDSLPTFEEEAREPQIQVVVLEQKGEVTSPLSESESLAQLTILKLKFLGMEERERLERAAVVGEEIEKTVVVIKEHKEEVTVEAKEEVEQLMARIRDLEGERENFIKRHDDVDMLAVLKSVEEKNGELLRQVKALQEKVGSIPEKETQLEPQQVNEELILQRLKFLGEEEMKRLESKKISAENLVTIERMSTAMLTGNQVLLLQERVAELEGDTKELLSQVLTLQMKVEPLAATSNYAKGDEQIMSPFDNYSALENEVLTKLKVLRVEELKRLEEAEVSRNEKDDGEGKAELLQALQDCVALVHDKDAVIFEQAGIIRDLTHMLEVKDHALDEAEQREEQMEEALHHAEDAVVKQQEIGRKVSEQIYGMRNKVIAAEERARIVIDAATSEREGAAVEQNLREEYENMVQEHEKEKQQAALLEKELRDKVSEAEKLKGSFKVAMEEKEALLQDKSATVRELTELKLKLEVKEAESKGGTAAGLAVLRKQHKAALLREREEAKKQMDGLEQRYTVKEAELASALKELAQFRHRKSETEEGGSERGMPLLCDVEKAEKNIQIQLQAAEEAWRKAQAEVEEKQKRIDEMSAEVSGRPAQSPMRQSAAAALLEVTERMKAEAAELKEESRTAERERDFFRATAERNEQKMKEATANQEGLKTEISVLLNRNKLLEKKVDDAVKVKFEGELTRLRDEHEASIAAEREKARVAMLELENRVQELGAQRGELEKQVEVLGVKLQQAQKMKEEAKAVTDGLQKLLDAKTGEKESLEKQMSGREREINRLEEELALLDKVRGEKEGEARVLRGNLEVALRELDEARREVKRGGEKVLQLGIVVKERAALEEKIRGLEGTIKVMEKQLSMAASEHEGVSRKAREEVEAVERRLREIGMELRQAQEGRRRAEIEVGKVADIVKAEMQNLFMDEKLKLSLALQQKEEEVKEAQSAVRGLEAEVRLLGASDGYWAKESASLREDLERSKQEAEEARKALHAVQHQMEVAEKKWKEEASHLRRRLQQEESETKLLRERLEHVRNMEQGKDAEFQKLSKMAAQQEGQLARISGEMEKLLEERNRWEEAVGREKLRYQQQMDAFAASANASQQAEVMAVRSEVEERSRNAMKEASAKQQTAEKELKKVKKDLEDQKEALEKEISQVKKQAAHSARQREEENAQRMKEQLEQQENLLKMQNETAELHNWLTELREEVETLRQSQSEEALKSKVARAFAAVMPSHGGSFLSSMKFWWLQGKMERLLGHSLDTRNESNGIGVREAPPPPPPAAAALDAGHEEGSAQTLKKRKGKKATKKDKGVSGKASVSTKGAQQGQGFDTASYGGQMVRIRGVQVDKVLMELGKVALGALLVLLVQQVLSFLSS